MTPFEQLNLQKELDAHMKSKRFRRAYRWARIKTKFLAPIWRFQHWLGTLPCEHDYRMLQSKEGKYYGHCIKCGKVSR